jgi:ketosteroid isomerase-like protein
MKALMPATLVVMVIALTAAANPPSPRATVEAMFAAFNRHDAAAMAALYSIDAMLNSSDFCAPRNGPAEVERTYAALFQAFPDIRDEGMTFVTEGNRAAVQFVARSDQGRLNLPIGAFLVVSSGRIIRDEAYFNAGAAPCSN